MRETVIVSLKILVLVAGLEPARYLYRGILSPLQHFKKALFLPIFTCFLPKIARF